MQSPDEQKRRQQYYEAIKVKLGKGMQYHESKLDPDVTNFVTPTHDWYEDKKEPASEMPNIDDLDEHYVYTYAKYGGVGV
jgi:hypothetical protein